MCSDDGDFDVDEKSLIYGISAWRWDFYARIAACCTQIIWNDIVNDIWENYWFHEQALDLTCMHESFANDAILFHKNLVILLKKNINLCTRIFVVHGKMLLLSALNWIYLLMWFNKTFKQSKNTIQHVLLITRYKHIVNFIQQHFKNAWDKKVPTCEKKLSQKKKKITCMRESRENAGTKKRKKILTWYVNKAIKNLSRELLGKSSLQFVGFF